MRAAGADARGRAADSGVVKLRSGYGISLGALEQANDALVANERDVARERVATRFCVRDFSCRHVDGARDQLLGLAGASGEAGKEPG